MIILITIQEGYCLFTHHYWVCGYLIIYQISISTMDSYTFYTHYSFLMDIIYPLWIEKGRMVDTHLMGINFYPYVRCHMLENNHMREFNAT